MKTTLLLFASALIFANSHAQTVLFSEDFETGSSTFFTLNTSDMGGTAAGDNPWVINNIYAGGSGSFFCPALGFSFPFTVPAAPQQPAGITNNPTSYHLHITPQIAIDAGGTLPAASYVAADGFCLFGGQSNFTRMSSDINTVGQDSVTLDFWWACGGSTLYYGEVYYSINGGANWLPVLNPASTINIWQGQATWTNTIVSDPSWANQATLRFGFRFITGSSTTGSEADPGFEIDDVEVKGFPACTATTGTVSPTSCVSYVSPSGNYTWTSSNTYMDTVPNMNGCDSVITVNLTIIPVNITITTNGIIQIANQSGGTYQWLDCNNNYAAVNGATGQNFTPTANGSYAVAVTANGCTDTSVCNTVNTVGIGGNDFATGFSIYPNPTKGNMTIDLGANYSSVSVKTTSITGQLISRQEFSDSKLINIQLNSVPGLYFLEVVTHDGKTSIFKVLRE